MPRSRCSTCGYPDFSDVEEDIPESIEETFKKEYLDSKTRSQQEANRYRTPHRDAEILKKSYAIAKTIQDPSGQLSKRRRKKLNALGEDRMNSDVVYSMNKQKRWQMHPDELLLANQNLGIDVIVIEKVHSRPGLCYFVDNENVKSVHFSDRNGTASPSGRPEGSRRIPNGRKSDAQEGPYIEYRIVRPTRNTRILLEVAQPECISSPKKFNRNRSKKMKEENDTDYEEFSEDSDEDLDYEEDSDEQTGFKLADYMAAQRFDFFKKTQGSKRPTTKTTL